MNDSTAVPQPPRPRPAAPPTEPRATPAAQGPEAVAAATPTATGQVTGPAAARPAPPGHPGAGPSPGPDPAPGQGPGQEPEPAAQPAAEPEPDPAAPAPLGVDRVPTGLAGVDSCLERLADADHLAIDGHMAVYEDVHQGLRDALTALDTQPGPLPPPTAPGGADPRS